MVNVEASSPLSLCLFRLQAIEQLYVEKPYKDRQVRDLGQLCDTFLSQTPQMCLVCRPDTVASGSCGYYFNPQAPVGSLVHVWKDYEIQPTFEKCQLFWEMLIGAANVYGSQSWMGDRLGRLYSYLYNVHYHNCIWPYQPQTFEATHPVPRTHEPYNHNLLPAVMPHGLEERPLDETAANFPEFILPAPDSLSCAVVPPLGADASIDAEPSATLPPQSFFPIPAPRSKQGVATSQPVASTPVQLREVKEEEPNPVEESIPVVLAASSSPKVVGPTQNLKKNIEAMRKEFSNTIIILKGLSVSFPECEGEREAQQVVELRTKIQVKLSELNTFTQRRCGRSDEDLQAYLKTGEAMLQSADLEIKVVEAHTQRLKKRLASPSSNQPNVVVRVAKVKEPQEPQAEVAVIATKPCANTQKVMAHVSTLVSQIRLAQEGLNKQYEAVDALLQETDQQLGKSGQSARDGIKKKIKSLLAIQANSLTLKVLEKHVQALQEGMDQIRLASEKATKHLAVLEGQKAGLAKKKRKAEQEIIEKKASALLENVNYLARLRTNTTKLEAMRATVRNIPAHNFQAFHQLVLSLGHKIQDHKGEKADEDVAQLLQFLGSEEWRNELVQEMVLIYARTPHTNVNNTFYHVEGELIRPIPLVAPQHVSMPLDVSAQVFLKLYMECLVRETRDVMKAMAINISALNKGFEAAQQKLVVKRALLNRKIQELEQFQKKMTAMALTNKDLYEKLGISVHSSRFDIGIYDALVNRDLALSVSAIESMNNEELLAKEKDIQKAMNGLKENERRMLKANKILQRMINLKPCIDFLFGHVFASTAQDLDFCSPHRTFESLYKDCCTLKQMIFEEKKGVYEKAKMIHALLVKSDLQQEWQAYLHIRATQAEAEAAKCKRKAEECGEDIYNISKTAQELTLVFHRQFQSIDEALSKAASEEETQELMQRRSVLEKEREGKLVKVTTESEDQIPLVTSAIEHIQTQKEFEIYAESLRSDQFSNEWKAILVGLSQTLNAILVDYKTSNT